MPPELLCDSDVILKLCTYRLEVWSEGRAFADRSFGTLAASRYILPKRLAKVRANSPRTAVLASWRLFESAAEFLEPSEAEVGVAAELEDMAQREGDALDAGESLLVAMLVARGLNMLVTGDKRAVVALGRLCPAHKTAAQMGRRVVCLEQLIAHVVAREGGASVRASICSEPQADQALANCFRCASSPAAKDSAYLEGLESYVRHLEERSGGVLCDGGVTPANAPSADASEENGVGLR